MSVSTSTAIASQKFIPASDASVLEQISRAETLLAIWQRPPLPSVECAIQALLAAKDPVQLDDSSSNPVSLRQSLEAHLKDPSRHVADACAALASDFLMLLEKFREISGREHLRLRFERVEDDGCALFHVDTLPMRMLCTYAGPGTQWVEEENVRRDQLGSRGRGTEETNAAIVIDPDEIQTAPAWHVLVFKGRLWDGHGYSDGLVHRSAPVRHPTDYRLRLTIDFSDSCTC